MTECPKCKGRGTVGYYHIDHFVDIECDRCNGSGEVSEVEITNEEYLKSCNTEQLAEYLASTFDLCGAGCHHCFLANVCLTKARNGNCLTQEQMIVEWLKQPHKDGE